MFGDSCWMANLSDGTSHVEKWIDGHPSPWRRLIAYCEANRCHLTNLRMTVGKQTVSTPKNARGYWHANAMPSVQGIPSDEEVHKWHGIGWVDNVTGKLRIIWGALDPATHEVVFWTDEREPDGQNQIIWARPEWNHLDPEGLMLHSDENVRGMKEYAQRIELEHGKTT